MIVPARIRHQAEAEQFDAGLFLAGAQQLEESEIVARFSEDAHAAIPAVEDMADYAAKGGPSSAWHLESLPIPTERGKFDGCHLFSI